MKGTLLVSVIALIANAARAQYTAQELPTPSGTGMAVAAGGGLIVGNSLGVGGGPALWDISSHTYTSLTPTGFTSAEANTAGGGKQGGVGFVGGAAHALLWSGSAKSVVDLHPSSYAASAIHGTDGQTHVGVANLIATPAIFHAVLWRETPLAVLDLHPKGYVDSQLTDVWGEVQIGEVDGGEVDGAAMWRGTPESMSLLPLPKGYAGSIANGVYSDQIVGGASVNGSGHAILWGTDGVSFVDLTPKGWGAFALDTNGAQQVGAGGQSGGGSRALVWSGTSSSMVDLHSFLPNGFTESFASGIDEGGSIVGWATRTGVGTIPIVWTPVPEPAGLLALAFGIGALAMKRRRKR